MRSLFNGLRGSAALPGGSALTASVGQHCSHIVPFWRMEGRAAAASCGSVAESICCCGLGGRGVCVAQRMRRCWVVVAALPLPGGCVVGEVGWCAACVVGPQGFDACEWMCSGREWYAGVMCAWCFDRHPTRRRCGCRGQRAGVVVSAGLHSGSSCSPPLLLFCRLAVL